MKLVWSREKEVCYCTEQHSSRPEEVRGEKEAPRPRLASSGDDLGDGGLVVVGRGRGAALVVFLVIADAAEARAAAAVRETGDPEAGEGGGDLGVGGEGAGRRKAEDLGLPFEARRRRDQAQRADAEAEPTALLVVAGARAPNGFGAGLQAAHAVEEEARRLAGDAKAVAPTVRARVTTPRAEQQVHVLLVDRLRSPHRSFFLPSFLPS